MASAAFTNGSTRIQLTSDQVTQQQAIGTLLLDARRRRPLYFDGRFLAATDLAREQDYFLQRQADLGRSAGFGVVHGLEVSVLQDDNGRVVADGLRVTAGQGVTPSGKLVLLPDDRNIHLSDLAEEEKLDLSFGLGVVPHPPFATRTGLFVLALRPLEFTANPIASYPTSIQGAKQTHDGDIVEATGIALIPYPSPVSSYEPSQRRAAVAWQIFGGQSVLASRLNDSLLPIAIVSLQRGTVEWVDEWLVRRELGAEFSGQRFGLTDEATQLAFFQQYDTQLQEVLAVREHAGLTGNFSASQYFRLLPPTGRFPLASIDVVNFTQAYFPARLDVRLSIVPVDEVPALIEESTNLPPLDLTLSDDSYRQLAVAALIPVARPDFAALSAKLMPSALRPALPQIISFRRPIDLLRLYRGDLQVAPPAIDGGASWAAAAGGNKLGFYVRRRSAPHFAEFGEQP